MKHSIRRCKKTYAIYNLAEKHTVFYLGKTRVHVSFTGGVITKKGVTPATFTTSDPVVQLSIENSPDFKRGAIRVVASYPQNGEVSVGMNPEVSAVSGETADSVVLDDTAVADLNASAETVTKHDGHESEGTAEISGEDMGSAEDEADAGTAEGECVLEVVEASCKDVAKQYLHEHFGENPAPLRTRQDVQDCAARHGIVFEFV